MTLQAYEAALDLTYLLKIDEIYDVNTRHWDISVANFSGSASRFKHGQDTQRL
ncbi:hypothetical protein [Xanthomonas nasturtii]|uniref:hypothetical protein n=1 Tax=Xanthomonas nasturtii TaxID=1843581 RepID=UPI0020121AAD|nr:hypothetical protein [Xanthomonas nasturtii]MCL1572693.1 hypothetical protein [Xanthomonas nasturtii]